MLAFIADGSRENDEVAAVQSLGAMICVGMLEGSSDFGLDWR